MNRFLVLAILVGFGAGSFCFAQAEERTDQEMGGFSLVQYEDGGAKKWELSGRSAEVRDGKVKINEVSALTFGGDTTLKLKARQGTFDREQELVHLENNVIVKTTDGTRLSADSLDWDVRTKDVFTDVPVTIKRHGLEAKGIGAEMNLKDKTAKLKKDVTVSITSMAPSYLATSDPEPLTSFGYRAGNQQATTTITCDGPLELNYKKNRATFRNNVKVVDQEGTIFADRVDVCFSPDSRKIKYIAAKGNVRIVNGENVTYSDKAIYLVDQGRVILPKRPRLVIKNEVREQ